jgi:hypothetical protein
MREQTMLDDLFCQIGPRRRLFRTRRISSSHHGKINAILHLFSQSNAALRLLNTSSMSMSRDRRNFKNGQ